jgi:hypothetical protein
MSELLSTTLLFPYRLKENTFFYFFSESHDKDLKDKLEILRFEIENIVINEIGQNFNIVFFCSDYEELIADSSFSIESTTTVAHYSKLLSQFLTDINKLTNSFNSLNSLLVYHSPWFQEEHVKAHKTLIDELNSEQVQKSNSMNKFHVSIFAHTEKDISPIAFNIMSYKGIQETIKFIDNPDDWNNISELIKHEPITHYDIKFYKESLSEYKGRLQSLDDNINSKEDSITIELFAKEEKFWENSKEDSKKGNDNKIEFKERLKKFKKLDIRSFKQEWNLLIKDIEDDFIRLKSQLANKSFKFSDKKLSGIDKDTQTIKTESRSTLSDELKKRLEKYKVEIQNENFATQKEEESLFQKSQAIYFKTLNKSKTKIALLLRKSPSQESMRWFVALLLTIVIIPLIALFILPTVALADISMIIFTVPIIFIIIIGSTIWFSIWKKNYYRELKRIESTISTQREEYKAKVEDIINGELNSLNARVYNKNNFDIIYKRLNELCLKEEEENKRSDLIKVLLENVEFGNLKASSSNKTNKSIHSLEDFLSEICIFTSHNNIDKLFKRQSEK